MSIEDFLLHLKVRYADKETLGTASQINREMREENVITLGINLSEKNSKFGTHEWRANALITKPTDSSTQRETSEISKC